MSTPEAHSQVAENLVLERWESIYRRRPDQINTFNGSDAELVPLVVGKALATTVDTIEEEIRAGLYADPELAGWVAAVATLSDLAAVGADPLGLLVSVTLPERRCSDVQAAVARGIEAACRSAGTHVLGGDTNLGMALSITGVGIGVVPVDTAITRIGASPGDLLMASGSLGAGGAFAAARLLKGVTQPVGFSPVPRLAEGALLRGLASACMDTSDGLLATADQIARLNGVGIELSGDLDGYLDPDASVVAAQCGLPPICLLASHHGEFELVFSLPSARYRQLERRASRLGWTPRRIGRVVSGAGVSLGGNPIDTVGLRNLAPVAGADPVAYARALVHLCGAS